MTDDADPRRAEARRLWSDLTLTQEQIAGRVGIPRTTLMSWAASEQWLRPKRKRKPKRRQKSKQSRLIKRLYSLVERNIERLEQDVMSDEKSPEAHARILSNTVRSIEKIGDLENDTTKRDTAATGTGRKPLTPDEEDRLREELIERLIRLRDKHATQGNDERGPQ